jgi:hypothetical protein
MTDSRKDTWYVSFDVPKDAERSGRHSCRATQTFQNESEAKEFARMKSAEGLNVNAGTINPHLPKRAIAPTRIHQWVEQARGPGASD